MILLSVSVYSCQTVVKRFSFGNVTLYRILGTYIATITFPLELMHNLNGNDASICTLQTHLILCL